VCDITGALHESDQIVRFLRTDREPGREHGHRPAEGLQTITRHGIDPEIIAGEVEGHDQDNAPTRDAVKRTALRRPVSSVEILPEHSADDIRSLLGIALKIAPDPSAAARRPSSPPDPAA
jgi:hypothetical protein